MEHLIPTKSSTCESSSSGGNTPMVTFMNSRVDRTTSFVLDRRKVHTLDNSLFKNSVPRRSVCVCVCVRACVCVCVCGVRV